MMTTLKEAAVDLCPAPVELISDPMGGRYVVANKDIERGAVVLVARPYAVGITSEGVCAHCLAEVDIDAAAYTGKRNAAAKKAAAAANGGKNGSRATVPPPSADAVSCAGCGLSYCSKMCYDNHAAYHRGTGHCRVHQLIRACDLATRLDRCDLESVTLIAAMLARAVASGEFQKLVDEKRKQKAEADAAKARSSSSPPASVSATAVNSDPRAPTSVSVKAVAKSDADGEGGEEARRETDESKFVTLTDPSQAAWLASPTSTRFGPIEPTFADVLALVSNVEGMSSSDRKRFDVAFSAYDRTLRMAEARTPIPVWSPLGEVEMVEPTKDAAHTFLPKIGQALFYRLASIDQCNSFGFWHRHPSVSHFCRATATIPAAALFNHSCSPNLVRMNAGASPVFVALHDIKKGTALCISYIDTTQELGDRQDTLQSTYKFGCGCDRCTVETRMMSSIGHLKSDYQPLRSSIIPCASCHNGLLLPADTPIVKTLVGTLPSVVAAAAIGKDQRKALRAAAAAAVARAEAEIEETDDENDANDQDPVSATSKKKAESLKKKAHLPTEFRCSCCFGFASLAL